MNLLNQGFLVAKLTSSLLKLYCRHNDLVYRYWASGTQMTTDMLPISKGATFAAVSDYTCVQPGF